MDSRKRKFGTLGLGRRVRARAEPEPDLADEDEFSDDSVQPDEPDAEDSQDTSAEELGNESKEDPSLSNSATSGEEEEEEDDDDDDDVVDTSAISFGALARAQASLRRKETATTRQSSSSSRDVERHQQPPREGGAGARKPLPARANKHAPQELTSKRPVRRGGMPVGAPSGGRRAARDPRFAALPGGGKRADEAKLARAYAFLDEYRDGEMAELRAAAARARDPSERERLQRAATSMASQKAARARRDRERAVIAEHRTREKELVRQGKKPFYLKKSEQKKRLLLDEFASLKPREVDRKIERRRKKAAAKERKAIPLARRGLEG